MLYLLARGVESNNINWIMPNDAWLFNRDALQVGKVAHRVLEHAEHFKRAKTVDDVFLEIEKTGGIIRIDEQIIPTKWRCATVSPEEVIQLRKVKNIIRKGRVKRIKSGEIQLQNGTVSLRTMYFSLPKSMDSVTPSSYLMVKVDSAFSSLETTVAG